MRLQLLALASFAALAVLTSPAHGASTLAVVNVWSRPAIGTGVVYATIHNGGNRADELLSASSPVAKAVELHESVQAPTGTTSKGMNGMAGMPAMMMHEVSRLVVPASGTAALEPGGYHIMLIGLRHDLKPGETFAVTLRFKNAGFVHVISHVRPIP